MSCHKILSLPSKQQWDPGDIPIRLWLSVQETAGCYKAQWGLQSLPIQGVAKMPHPPLLVLFKINKDHHREGLSSSLNFLIT